jgi:hypothetical protein
VIFSAKLYKIPNPIVLQDQATAKEEEIRLRRAQAPATALLYPALVQFHYIGSNLT